MLVFVALYLYDLISEFMSIHTVVPITPVIAIKPIAQISQWHLFGVYDDRLSELPETQLALILQGTMLSSNNSKQSFAIVSADKAQAKVYKIGDVLPGDAILERIANNEIVIRYQGQLQSLKLPINFLVPGT